jgi:hypothetical protein
MVVEVKGALGFGLSPLFIVGGRFGHYRSIASRLKL